MVSLRLEKGLRLRDAIAANQSQGNAAEDILFMHILECIGTLSCIREDQKKKEKSDIQNSGNRNSNQAQASALLSCKHRVFWQAVRDIADRASLLEDIPATEEKKKSSALNCLLECFPDETKQSNGRLWLSLHFSVCLPSSRLEDIETLFTANPAAILSLGGDDEKPSDGDHSTVAAVLSSRWVIIG